MKVTVMDRSTDSFYPYDHAMTVEVSDKCPVCGKERGKPWDYHFYEDGYTFTVSRWNNPCGHIDYYRKVLEEARALKGVR